MSHHVTFNKSTLELTWLLGLWFSGVRLIFRFDHRCGYLSWFSYWLDGAIIDRKINKKTRLSSLIALLKSRWMDSWFWTATFRSFISMNSCFSSQDLSFSISAFEASLDKFSIIGKIRKSHKKFKSWKMTSMLVTDVGDEMCWWKLEYVGDSFCHFWRQHLLFSLGL